MTYKTEDDLPAYLYLRLSQDRTGEGAAVERQDADGRLLAAAKHWPIAGVFSDNDRSATDESVTRDDFEKMIKLVEAGTVRRIIVWHLDRLVRRMDDLMRLINAGKKWRLNIASVNGVSLDLGDPTGVAVAQILTAIAGMETAHKAERQRRRNLADREAGRPPARQAFGYSVDGMSIDPVLGPVARSLFLGVLAGEAISEMTRRLNAGGFRTTERVSPKTGAVNGGGEWKRSNVLALLKNPRYAAIRTQDVREGKTVRKVEVGPGAWPEIVSRDEFEAVQMILSDDARKSNKGGTARIHLGGGLFRCGIDGCGSDVKTAYRAGGTRIYQCRVSKHLGRVADPVDAWVRTAVATALTENEDIRGLLAPDEDPALPGMRTEAATLRARQDQLALDYAEGLLNGRQLQLVTAKITARLETLDARLADAARSTGFGDLLLAPDPGEAFLAAPLGVQRSVIEVVTDGVVIRAGRAGRAPFDPRTVEVALRGKSRAATGAVA